MKYNPLPPVEFLDECLEYNFMTGALTWRERPQWHFQDQRSWNIWNTKFAFRQAGGHNGAGYLLVAIKNVKFMAHRIIWAMATGVDPTQQIDHRNECKDDNRWSNLRDATSSQNRCNRGSQANNKSGYKGVRFDRRYKNFNSSIRTNNKRKHLGCFATAEEAYKAYCDVVEAFHGEFANVGVVA